MLSDLKCLATWTPNLPLLFFSKMDIETFVPWLRGTGPEHWPHRPLRALLLKEYCFFFFFPVNCCFCFCFLNWSTADLQHCVSFRCTQWLFNIPSPLILGCCHKAHTVLTERLLWAHFHPIPFKLCGLGRCISHLGPTLTKDTGSFVFAFFKMEHFYFSQWKRYRMPYLHNLILEFPGGSAG